MKALDVVSVCQCESFPFRAFLQLNLPASSSCWLPFVANKSSGVNVKGDKSSVFGTR